MNTSLELSDSHSSLSDSSLTSGFDCSLATNQIVEKTKQKAGEDTMMERPEGDEGIVLITVRVLWYVTLAVVRNMHACTKAR